MQMVELSINNIEEIKALFRDVFMSKPWNDNWSDDEQLHQYIKDLIGNANSLTYGLMDGDELIGVAMGSIRHWWTGTEYNIDELCIGVRHQGHGYGKMFLNLIETRVREKGIINIFLQTERSVLAYDFYSRNGYTEMPNHVSFHKIISDPTSHNP